MVHDNPLVPNRFLPDNSFIADSQEASEEKPEGLTQIVNKNI